VNRMIALDWGTSSLRAALLDAHGAVLDTFSSSDGILQVPPGGFPSVFASAVRRWEPEAGTLCLASGMVGSRQGWLEAPYCECPTGFAELGQRLAWVDDAPLGVRLGIVPGLCTDPAGVPDVMRGEETQVFGALDLLGLDSAVIVLPGTHSKWVQVQRSRIQRFATFMTGECYALLRRHSILARTLPEDDGALDEDAFARGVAHAREAGSLLHGAFSVRTLALFDRLSAEALPSYLSGLVIGEELRTQTLPTGTTPLVVIGADALTLRYRLALQSLGVTVMTIGAEAGWRGLSTIARSLKDPHDH